MTKPSQLTCEEVFRRLDDYLDRALSPDEARTVEEHLATCIECAGEYNFEGTWIEEVRGRVQRIQLPEGLMHAIQQNLAKFKAS